MKFVGRCYRAHDPAWSFKPMSGQGAALRGGRFNVKKRAAVYLSLDAVTAMIERSQGFSARLSPITLCEYDVECTEIADLRTSAGREEFSISLGDLSCGWLTYQLNGIAAPSQKIAADLEFAGYNGMLVPSFAPEAPSGSTNLVLWNWGPSPPHQVTVYDPSGKLPKNQLSWE